MSYGPTLPKGDSHARFSAVAHDTVAQTDLVLGWLEDTDWKVCAFGLRKLSHGPVVHVATIVAMLTDLSPNVRRDALVAIGKHERAATLASHAGAIAGMFTDSFAGVRYDALRMFDSDAMGMPAPDVVILACRVVANMLTDEDISVRRAATNTLVNIKRMRARLVHTR
jgi:HEAT repeat protein